MESAYDKVQRVLLRSSLGYSICGMGGRWRCFQSSHYVIFRARGDRRCYEHFNLLSPKENVLNNFRRKYIQGEHKQLEIWGDVTVTSD